ncbi:MAG: Tll0287-like domain-containing protein [Shinella sp.]|uniref:Tll0287-like domain-containing protein n=1 Tax=Shinella sp. TaxID=1870904 RepID=UPI0040368E6B
MINPFVKCGLAALLVLPLIATGAVAAEAGPADLAIARNLATMLQSARAVVSVNQDLINDPALGDKGLTGAAVLEKAIANYSKATGRDPNTIDPASYEGRLIQAQMDAVVEVMDANQSTINAKGVGFKGFIPATFTRLVAEAFEARVGEEASMKFTAPPVLIRNRKARPDTFEAAAIRDYLEAADWPKGQIYSAMVSEGGQERARIMVPEYYVPSCLTCHGAPAGELDITGYPKEGAHEGDLGGVISIGLIPQ